MGTSPAVDGTFITTSTHVARSFLFVSSGGACVLSSVYYLVLVYSDVGVLCFCLV